MVVFSGMLSSTLLAIPFVPMRYVAFERRGARLRRKPRHSRVCLKR